MNRMRSFDPVSYDDRWFLDLEERGGLVTHMGALQLFDETPLHEDVLASVEFLSNLVPRFRRKVVTLQTGLPLWVEARDFQPEDHLRTLDVTDGGLGGLLAASAQFYARPFDPSKPLWEVLFMRSDGATPSALFTRAHHMIGDGMSMFRLEPSRPIMDVDLSVDALQRSDARKLSWALRIRDFVDLANEGGRTAKDLLMLPSFRREARGQLRALAHYSSQAMRSTKRRPCRPGSLRWFSAVAARTVDWRDAAHDLDVGMNELFLAVGIRAVADYWGSQGFPLATVNVGMPVNARSSPDDPEAGNKVLRAWFSVDPLNVGSSDLSELRTTCMEARDTSRIPMTPLTDLVLRGLPRSVRQRLQLAGLAATDLLASNLRYPRDRFEFAKRTVTRIYGFAPAMGIPVSMALCSYGDETTLGVSVDRAQITHPALMEECLDKHLEQLSGGRISREK